MNVVLPFLSYHPLSLVLSILLIISRIQLNNASFLSLPPNYQKSAFHILNRQNNYYLRHSSSLSDNNNIVPSTNTLISDLPPAERGIGVGVDLGTTNSAIAIFSSDGIPRLISIEGESTMPSVVSVSSNPYHHQEQLKRKDDTVESGKVEDEEQRERDECAQEYKILIGNACVTDEDKQNDNESNSEKTFTYRHVKRIIGMGANTAACNVDVVPHMVIYTASQRRKGRNRNKKNKVEGMGRTGLSLSDTLKDSIENPVTLHLPQQEKQAIDEDFSGNQDLVVEDDVTADTKTTTSPEFISSLILKKMFDTAEQSTGERITRVVVGVPAYFNDQQRESTTEAVTLAASIPRERIRLLREPEAAALAYGIGKKQIGKGDDEELVLVFDLGGGTFDVSILEIGGGVYEVVATGGNIMLGGSDFDAKIAQLFSKIIVKHGCAKNYWKDAGDVAAMMLTVAERCRIALSNSREVFLRLALTAEGWLNLDEPTDAIVSKSEVDEDITEMVTSDGMHVIFKLTRKEMEKLCLDEFQALLRPVREVAILAGALLPGETSPSAIEDFLQMEEDAARTYSDNAMIFDSFYDKENGEADDDRIPLNNNKLEEDIDQDTLLQLKTFELNKGKKAQQRGRKRARDTRKNERKFREEKRKADEKARRKSVSSKKTKIQDGINGRMLTQVVLVGGATRMPAIGRLLAAVTGVVPQRTVNPDEAVALGCAVQVGILDGINTELQVLNPMEAAVMRALARKRGLDFKES